MLDSSKQIICPTCSSQQSVPIAYGFPGPEMIAQVERGEIILGGCVVEPDQPDRHCHDCGQSWNTKSAQA